MAVPIAAKAATLAQSALKRRLVASAVDKEERKKNNKLLIFIGAGVLSFFHIIVILYTIITSFATSFLGSIVISVADFFTDIQLQSYVDELLAYQVIPEPIKQEKFGLLTMPCEGFEDQRNVTAGFGYSSQYLSGVYHTGIDFANAHFSPVTCVFDGTVSFIGYKFGYGRMVIVEHGGGFETYYAHLANTHVIYGQTVDVGTVLGYQGGDTNTDPLAGTSTGSHLHFEIRHNNVPCDPDKFLFQDKWTLAKEIAQIQLGNVALGKGLNSLPPEQALLEKLLIFGKFYKYVYTNGVFTGIEIDGELFS